MTKTNAELAEEIERYLAPDATYHHWGPSLEDMEQIIAALRRGPERDLPEYHGKECYYCHEIISTFDSTRGPGGCALCHADEPGVVKWHHSSCVSQRLPERPPSGEMVTVPMVELKCLLLSREWYEGNLDGALGEIEHRVKKLLSAAEAEVHLKENKHEI